MWMFELGLNGDGAGGRAYDEADKLAALDRVPDERADHGAGRRGGGPIGSAKEGGRREGGRLSQGARGIGRTAALVVSKRIAMSMSGAKRGQAHLGQLASVASRNCSPRQRHKLPLKSINEGSKRVWMKWWPRAWQGLLAMSKAPTELKQEGSKYTMMKWLAMSAGPVRWASQRTRRRSATLAAVGPARSRSRSALPYISQLLSLYVNRRPPEFSKHFWRSPGPAGG
jgi:hypothetical protein